MTDQFVSIRKLASVNSCYLILGAFLLVNILPGLISAQIKITDATDRSITISWLAPGDDGIMGTGSGYDFRYDSAPISSISWDAASSISQSLQPLPAGSQQSYEITGVSVTEGNYFALKGVDEADNWTLMTNNVTILPTPVAGEAVIDYDLQTVQVNCQTIVTSENISYLIEFDSVNSFATAQTATGIVAGNEVSAMFGPVAFRPNYFWRCRVQADDSLSTSLWSAPQTIDMTIGGGDGTPWRPTAQTPADGVTVNSLTPTLVVTNGYDFEGDPLTYEFQLFTEDGLVLVDSVIGIAEELDSTSWTTVRLRSGSSYLWRSRCYDGFTYSPWDSTRSFTVLTVVTGTDTEAVRDPYPSPVNFNLGDMLTFELPDDETLELKILDVGGDLVFSRRNLSGFWQWDGRDGDGGMIANGTYLWYLSDNWGKGKFIVLR